MALGDVFAAIERELNDQTIRFRGPDRGADESNHSRIDWDPDRGLLTHAERAGGGPGDDGDIAVRTWLVRVVVWAGSFEALEALVDRFYAAAHDIGTHFTFPPNAAETWHTGGVTANGASMTAVVQVKVGVRRTAMTVATPDAVVETPVIDDGQ